MTPINDSVILSWPFALIVILACAVLAVVVTLLLDRVNKRKDRGQANPETLWVANSAYVRELPEFKKQLRTYRTLQGVAAGFLTLSVVSTAVLAANPARVKVNDPLMANRDIVLCLDVSGSMLKYDRELVDVFSTLVDNFVGERIALSIFNSTSRVVFPLTDDYDMVKEQLTEAYESLDPAALNGDSAAFARYDYFTAGANTIIDAGSSLVGDGLASCALQFSNSSAPALVDGETPAQDARARSIIFASDNVVQGTEIYSLKDSVELASELDIALIGIYGSSGVTVDGEKEFQQAFTRSGGMYFYSDDPLMMETIVDDVQSRQAVEHNASPTITQTNTAGPWFIVLVVGLLGFFATTWRLKE